MGVVQSYYWQTIVGEELLVRKNQQVVSGYHLYLRRLFVTFVQFVMYTHRY